MDKGYRYLIICAFAVLATANPSTNLCAKELSKE